MRLHLEIEQHLEVTVDEGFWNRIDGSTAEKVATVLDNIHETSPAVDVASSRIGEWVVNAQNESETVLSEIAWGDGVVEHTEEES